MSNIFNIARYIPKKSFSVLFAVLSAVVLTLSATAAPAVQIEADLGVANVTRGDTQYADSVAAGYDEVVKVQLWYHNMENEDSGLVAENLKATFNVPETQGELQTISATVGGDNTNRVTDEVTIDLGREDAYLEYIPGTAKWRHNAGTNASPDYVTEEISDNVVNTGVVIEDAQPCFNFEATVTILLRVRMPSVSIDKQISTPDNPDGWQESMTVDAGDKVKFLFTVINDGNARLENVILGDVFPEGVTYVDGSTIVTNENHPDGVNVSSNDINDGGLNLGNFAIGGYSYVTIEAMVADIETFECGVNNMVNKAVVKSDKAALRTDEATVKVNKVCEEEEEFVYRCDTLNVSILDREARKVKATAQTTTSDNVNVVGVSIDFGDGTVVDQNGATHTYNKDGTYTIEATVAFELDNENKDVEEDTCTAKVTFEADEAPVPEELPNTGPGSFIAAIFGAGSVTTAVRSWLASRRALNSIV